jgi:hypothetical protein
MTKSINIKYAYIIAGAGSLFGLIWLYTENKNEKPNNIIKTDRIQKAANENQEALKNLNTDQLLQEKPNDYWKERPINAFQAFNQQNKNLLSHRGQDTLKSTQEIQNDKTNKPNNVVYEYFTDLLNPIIGTTKDNKQDPQTTFVGGSRKRKGKRRRSRKSKKGK